jgi:hypothetical protein
MSAGATSTLGALVGEGDANLQDEKGHDDGEYAIAEHFNLVFADFKSRRVECHDNIYSAQSDRRDSTPPHLGQQ